MTESLEHPNVKIVYGGEHFPERKEPGMLYLAASTPDEPFQVACQITGVRFRLLQEFVQAGNRVIGYNAEQRPVAFAR